MKPILISMLIFSLLDGTTAEARKRKRGPKLQVPANQVVKLEGTATVNGQPAVEFMGIKTGDEIETGEKSVAAVRVAGLGIFRLNEKTKLKLKQVGDRNNSVVELESGQVLALYRRLGNHTFVTPKAKFMIKEKTTLFASGDEICLCNGSITTHFSPKGAASPAPANAAVAATAVAAEPQVWSADPNHKIIVFTESGPVLGSQKELSGHSNKLIEDLDAIYALP